MWNDHEACYRVIETGDSRFDGRIYTGVKTTGIYCRPVCAARTPRRRNVEFFPSAAAAQNAGYRPCLRCRPELSPAPGNTGDIPDVVTRALNLITDGALDEDGMPALVARVGISESQLRRLFLEHLGASPLKIVQTRRVLFAKQLLHDTKLSMAEVAMAAGFANIYDLSKRGGYEELRATTDKLSDGLIGVFDASGVQAAVNRVCGLLTVFFTGNPVFDMRTASATDREAFGAFFHGMVDNGVYLPPSQFEAWFVSTAHTDADIEQTLDAVKKSLPA